MNDNANVCSQHCFSPKLFYGAFVSHGHFYQRKITLHIKIKTMKNCFIVIYIYNERYKTKKKKFICALEAKCHKINVYILLQLSVNLSTQAPLSLSLLQHQQTHMYVCTWKWTMVVEKYLEYYTQVSLQVSNIKWFTWIQEKLTKRLKIYSLKVLLNKMFLNEGLLTKYIVLK